MLRKTIQASFTLKEDQKGNTSRIDNWIQLKKHLGEYAGVVGKRKGITRVFFLCYCKESNNISLGYVCYGKRSWIQR